MRRSSSAVMGWKCAKSKRRRSGATSEPFCCTCVPSTWRGAACGGGGAGREVRGGVIGLAGLGARGVDFRVQLVARADRALLELADVRVGLVALLRVRDLEAHAVRFERAGVTDLAAGLRIERSAIEEDL